LGISAPGKTNWRHQEAGFCERCDDAEQIDCVAIEVRILVDESAKREWIVVLK
jgi:hypothetical protein